MRRYLSRARLRAQRFFWAIGLVTLTLAPSASAYRTAGDLEEFEGTEKVRWERPLVQFVMAGAPPGGEAPADVLDLVNDAFARWSEPSCSQVVLTASGMTRGDAEPEDFVNTIEWVSVGWEERGYLVDAPAVADVQYARVDDVWRIVEADLYLNADTVDWSFRGFEVVDFTDFETVMVHEAGHLLGLMHPCAFAWSPEEGVPVCSGNSDFDVTMNPEYQFDRLELAQDDVDGVCFLYPGVSCEVSGCPPGETCTEQGCRLTCGEATCAEGEVCVDEACQKVSPCVDDDCRCQGSGNCPEEGGGLSDGDPCGDDAECSSSTCAPDGFCSQDCGEWLECPDDWSCSAGVCDTSLLPFGETCQEADECIGEQCIAGLSSSPVCSRRCGEDHPECPLGWECLPVEGRLVCNPPPPEEGCSCRTAGRRSHLGFYQLLTVFFVFALALGRRLLVSESRHRGVQ